MPNRCIFSISRARTESAGGFETKATTREGFIGSDKIKSRLGRQTADRFGQIATAKAKSM